MALDDPWGALAFEPTDPRFGGSTPQNSAPVMDFWQTQNPDWLGQQHVSPPSALDSRIADLSGIYGDYSSALGNAQVDFDPFRQFYNQYYGQPSSGTSFGPGGGFSSQSATGQYLPIQQALQGAETYYGDQQGRYNEFYGDQQTRYGNLADQFLNLSMGMPDAEGNRTGGFYNTQYADALSGADSLYDLGMGVMGPDGVRTGGFYADQYTGALGNADALYGLSQGYTDPETGEWIPGFFADQYTGAAGDALGMRNRLTGAIDPETGLATGGLYGTQYNMDTALNEALYGASTYDEELGQWTGGAATSLANSMYDASTSFTSSVYDLAGGVLDDTGTRMGGFYQDQATNAVSAANTAYNAAAAEAVATNETRPVLDESGQPVLDEAGEPVTEDVVTYQGGFYSVQEANQIRRANMAQAQSVAQAAAVRAQQVQTATNLYNSAKTFFSNEKDAALGMLAAMEGVQTAPDATPEEIAAATAQGGARGRYTQQMSFFGEQEQRGIAELARQIGVVNAENVRRSGRVGTYEDLMVGEVDPLTGERPRFGGRIGEQEQALLERIGGLQSAATTEMDTVRASETQRLADLRSGYGEDISGAVAALQARGIDPTQLQAMTAQTGALLGAQEASQLAMLDRLQRAEGMLGSEQTLAATSMAGDARLALENQLFSTRTGIEEDIYGRLEGVEQQKFGVGEGAALGGFQAGQNLSGMLDELGRESYGYGSQARAGEFGARQSMEGMLGAAAIGESERVFDAGQRQASTVGAAGDMARAGIFQSGQQQASAVAQANAMRDAGLFTSENAYNMAMMQAQMNLTQGSSLANQNLLQGSSTAQSNLLAGTTQAQMSYDQALANARDAQALGGFQSDVGYQGSVADALAALQQGGYQSNMWLGQQQQDAASAQALGGFGAQNQYYQSMFDAMEQAQAGTFNATEAARTGIFNAGQTADAQVRATQTDQFNQMMQLAMQESSQGAGLQGDLAQANLTRDLAINAATQQSESDIQKAEAAAAAMVPVTQSWMAPGTATEMALTQMGYTPDVVANLDNTTLRGLVNDFWAEQRSDLEFDRGHVQTLLPWDQNRLYNEETNEFGYLSDYPGTGFPGGAISPWEQAQAAGFAPWQDPMSYTNAQYMGGDYPGTYGYQPDAADWTARDQDTGVGFPLGTMDQYGPTLENLNALKQYGALQGYPYPMGTDANSQSVAQWYQNVTALSMGLPLPEQVE